MSTQDSQSDQPDPLSAEGRVAAFQRALAPVQLPKRFYTDVAVRAVPAPGESDAAQPTSFALELDGRPVRTPSGTLLAVPAAALAAAIGNEWDRQGEHIDASTMPLTRLANTTIDRVVGRDDTIAAEISAYARSDLLCYRAEGPESLLSVQATHWDPPLQWAHERIGARLICSAGIVFHDQPPGALAAIDDWTCRLDAYALTALHNITTLTGSCILALALADGAIAPGAVWDAAHVDETWQATQWGQDEEALARLAKRRVEFDAAWNFFQVSRPAE